MSRPDMTTPEPDDAGEADEGDEPVGECPSGGDHTEPNDLGECGRCGAYIVDDDRIADDPDDPDDAQASRTGATSAPKHLGPGRTW